MLTTAVLLVAACAHEQEPTRIVVFPHAAIEVAPTPPVDPAQTPFGGEAIRASVAPAPIHGGTVLIAGSHVWVASPDTGVVDVIDIESRSIAHTFTLGLSSQLGRLAEDSTGAVSVVLRGEGAGRLIVDLARLLPRALDLALALLEELEHRVEKKRFERDEEDEKEPDLAEDGQVEIDLHTPSSDLPSQLFDLHERHEISRENLARELPRHPGNVYGAAVVA